MAFIKNISSRVFSNKNIRKFTTTLSKDGSLLPVVLLEASVIAGRTYHANKRGGKVEARERFTEESLAAVVWLWGMKTFNKVYDAGLKKLGIKHIGMDLGKDSIRNPIEKFFKDNPKIKKLPYTIAKSLKPILSAGLTIWMVGDVIPKYIHRVTDKRIKNELIELKETPKNEEEKQNINNTKGNNFLGSTTLSAQKRTSIEEFLQNAKNNPVSFTSSASLIKGMTQFAYNLENKDIYQLLTVDTGLVSGRGINARNKEERREIIFRDGASAIFYSLSTPIIAKALSHFDPFKAKNTRLDPNTVDFVHHYLLKNIDLKDEGIKAEHFEKKVFGEKHSKTKEIIEQVEKIVLENSKTKDASKELKQYAISLDKFENILKEKLSSKEVETFMQKAKEMSKLQPQHPSMGKILSNTQIKDVLSNGILNDAKFLKEALEKALEKPKVIKYLANRTTETVDNPMRFISQNKIDEKRTHIKDYVDSVIDAAVNKKRTNIVNKDLLEKIKMRNTKYKLIYTLVGMGISATFLSYIIPKLQYFITKQTTGEDGFPGVKNYKA